MNMIYLEKFIVLIKVLKQKGFNSKLFRVEAFLTSALVLFNFYFITVINYMPPGVSWI